MEVVAGLSDGFHQWLATDEDNQREDSQSPPSISSKSPAQDEDDDDIWLAPTTSKPTTTTPQSTTSSPTHTRDPQTLATAHRLFLRTLIRRLLLSQTSFTDPLYELLVHIDHLVALLHRLHSVWSAADLEADVGVVDAFVDLEREELDVEREILGVEGRIKRGIEGLIGELRRVEGD